MSAEVFSLPPVSSALPDETGGRAASGGRYGCEGWAAGPVAAPASPSLDDRRNNSARCARIVLVDRSSGEVKKVRCGSWRCDICAGSNRRAFRKRLGMGLQPATAGREVPKLLTLTSRPAEPPYISRRELSRRFAEVRRRLERALPGCEVQYAGTVELTRRGSVHFHVVLRGVPFMPQAVWSRLVAGAGFGPVVDIRRVGRGDQLAGYLTKALGAYLTKAASSTAWPAHFRRVRFSREWSPGWVSRGRRPRQPGQESPWVLLAVLRPGTVLYPWATVAGQGRPEGGPGGADP